MSRPARTLLYACALLFGSGLAQAFTLDLTKLVDIAKQTANLGDVDTEREKEIGRDMSAKLLGAAPLLDNPELQLYVNDIGQWIALQTELADLGWRFGILDTNDINAFAAPGGYIFLTAGLVGRLQSEAELAAVLAHEMGHVIKRHHLNAIQEQAPSNILSNVLSIAADQDENSAAWNQLIDVGSDLYTKGLSRDDEFDADLVGVVLLTRAGYDPYALAAVLQRLGGVNPDDSSLALMQKTHPPPDERLLVLLASMGERLDRFASQPQVEARFRQRMTGEGDG
jgi:predicted Zn-dependent protease